MGGLFRRSRYRDKRSHVSVHPRIGLYIEFQFSAADNRLPCRTDTRLYTPSSPLFQGRTADSVNEAAVAWEKSAEATNLALKEFGRLKPARKDPNSKSSFNINDCRDTAETVTVAADELRTLTAEVREFAESDVLTKYALAVERCTNHLAWRIVQLLLLIFVLALVYKIVVRRNSAFTKSA